MTTDEKKIGGIMFIRKETKKRGTFATNCNLFLLIVVIAITMVALGGCMDKITTNGKRTYESNWPPESENWPPILDPLVEQQIVQDWYEQYGIDLHNSVNGGRLLPLKYYGTHNDYVAIHEPTEAMRDVIMNFIVAGTVFRGSGWKICLWKDGFFAEMIDAYRQGLLTAEDIKAIGDIRRWFAWKAWTGSEESFNEYYFTIDETFEVIE